jgi:signal transduction histidine kinase
MLSRQKTSPHFWLGLLVLLLLSFPSFSQGITSVLRKAVTTPDSSEFYFSEAKKLIKQPSDQAEFDFAKNSYHSKSGILDSTIFYGARALHFFKTTNDLTKQVYILHNLGVAYRRSGQYEEALKSLFQAIPIADQLGDPTWQGWILQGISLNYHDFGSYQKGVAFGKKALEVLNQKREKEPMSVAIAINTIAINYDDWGKYDSALFFHLQVMDLKSKLDTLQIGFSYNNIGNTLIKLNRLDEAKKWINKAIAIGEVRQNQGSDESYDLSTNYINLGQILRKEGAKSEAKKALEKGLRLAKKSLSLEKIKDSYQAFYEFEKETGQTDSALVYLELLSEVEDSIFSIQNAKAISDAEAKYELSEKERNLAEERLTVQQSRFGIVVLASIMSLGLILGYHFFRQQKLKSIQKDQEIELQKALAKVETQSQLHEQRLKISRDLHDNIGSQLTFMTLGMDQLKTSVTPHSGPVLAQVESLKSFTNTTIRELRDTVWAMNQSQMTFGDIQSRILEFTESIAWNDELSLEIDFDENLENIQLGSFQGISIYRIIQESINNALKHAQATQITTRIRSMETGIKVLIQDNGQGFDLSFQGFKGNGLKNLESRVKELQGTISITSSPSIGTNIQIEIPFISS